MTEPTTEVEPTTTAEDQPSSSRETADRTKVSTRGVEFPGELTADNILDQTARGVRMVDSADDDQEAVERNRRIGAGAGTFEVATADGPDGVTEPGLASDAYLKGLEKGYIGHTAEDIPDEAFTVAGVTADPEVANMSGMRYDGVEDVHARAKRLDAMEETVEAEKPAAKSKAKRTPKPRDTGAVESTETPVVEVTE